MARDLQLRVVLSALDKATAPIRALTQTTGALGKAFKENRDKLKALNQEQRDVTAYRKANVEIHQQARALKELQAKHAGYVSALAGSKAAHQTNTQALKSARAQYNQLANALINGKGNTAQFKQELDKARIRLDAASLAFGQSQKAVKNYSDRIKGSNQHIENLKRQHESSQNTLGKLKAKLDEAGIGTDKLGLHSKKLKVQQEQLNKTLDTQRARLAAVAKQQERLAAAKSQYEKTQQLAGSMAAGGAAGLGVGYGVKNIAQQMLAPGVDYGAQMSELQAVSRLEKDDERFKLLKQQARDLGASTAFSATEVGAGQTFLARAGFSPEAIRSSMKDILDLALANGADLARTADIASNISGAFKIDPEVEGNMQRVADVLSGVSARANVDLEMLGDTMKYLGKAEGLGLSLEESAAMAGILGNIGIQSSQAGTTMRAMLDRLSAPATSGAKAMKALGLNVKDAAGNMRGLPDIIADVAKATEKMGNVDQAKYLKDIFGAEAGSGMAELVAQQGTGALTKLIEELYNVQGENSRMAATRADNIDGDLKSLFSAWEEIGIGITDINEGPLRGLIQQVTGILRATGEWAQRNPELVATLAKAVAVIGILSAAGGALMLTLAGLLGPIAMLRYGIAVLGIKAGALKAVFPAVAKSVAMLGKALLTTPLGLFVAASVVAVLFLIKYWDRAKAFMLGVVSGFTEGFKGMAYVLIESFKPLAPVIKAVIGWLSKFMSWIKKILAPVDSTQEKLKAASDAGRSFGKVFGALAALTTVVVAIKAVGSAVMFLGKALLANPIVAAVMAIAGLAYVIYRYWEPLKQFFAEVWSQVSAAFSSALQSINNLIASWSPIAWFNSAMAAVLGFFGVELPVTFTEFGAELIERFIGGVSAAWSGITEFFTNRWADIKSAFDGGLLGIATLILNWSPLGLFYQVFAAVFDWFGIELPGKFTEFGGMLMSGLINGIKGMAGSVKDAVVGVGESTVGWFKDKLGIRSPSRVFAEMGSDTAEGLAVGLAKNQSSPLKQVASLAKKVMAAGAITLGLGANVALAEAPPVSNQQQIIKQQVQSAELPTLTQSIKQVLITAKQTLPDLTQRIIGVFSKQDAMLPVADQQQVIQQSISAVSAPAVSDQHQLIKQQVQAAELPTLTQSIKQVVITAKQALPDLTQHIIGVFSGQDAVLPTLQQKLTAQSTIKFDTREPLAKSAPPAPALQPVSNITIHVHAAPGMDERALAQAVQRELSRAQQQQQVRNRSRLGDLD